MTIVIRYGEPAERKALDELQRRASRAWDDEHSDAAENPAATGLPLAQIVERRVRVAQIDG